MLTVDGGTKSICYAPKAAPDGDYSAHALAVPKLPKDKPLSASATARYVVKDRHGVVQHTEEVPMTKRAIARAFVDHFGFPDAPRSVSYHPVS